MRDLFTDSLNAPAGRLAEILLKKLKKGKNGREMPNDLIFCGLACSNHAGEPIRRSGLSDHSNRGALGLAPGWRERFVQCGASSSNGDGESFA
jgi:hypothetical protein